MPQNLIDTPAEWQDVIVVPAPGDQAAMANDATKPHSLFHALAALAKRTRWLRGLLETHDHDIRYYTKAEIDARRNVWAATIGGARFGGAQVSIQVTVPVSGPYLIEGSMIWGGGGGTVHWVREFWIDEVRVYSEQRSLYVPYPESIGGSWVDQIVYNLTAGTHSVVYKVTPAVEAGTHGTGPGMIKITML